MRIIIICIIIIIIIKIIVDPPLCRRVNGESWERNCHVIKMYSYCQRQAYIPMSTNLNRQIIPDPAGVAWL